MRDHSKEQMTSRMAEVSAYYLDSVVKEKTTLQLARSADVILTSVDSIEYKI